MGLEHASQSTSFNELIQTVAVGQNTRLTQMLNQPQFCDDLIDIVRSSALQTVKWGDRKT